MFVTLEQGSTVYQYDAGTVCRAYIDMDWYGW